MTTQPSRTLPAHIKVGMATAFPQYAGNDGTDYAAFVAERAPQWAKRAQTHPNPRSAPEAQRLATDPAAYDWSHGLGWRDIAIFERDVALAAEYGSESLRVSLDWAWTLAEPDTAWPAFRRQLETIRSHGMETVLCLWHFANPPAYSALDRGWTTPDILPPFADFCAEAVARLGDLVDVWLGPNEIAGYATRGYLQGDWMPGKVASVLNYRKVVKNLIHGHRLMARAIRARYPHARIGLPHAAFRFEPVNGRPYNRLAARLIERWSNYAVLDQVRHDTTFVAVNHYGTLYVKWGCFPMEPDATTPAEPFPGGTIGPLVLEMGLRYGKDVYVTEHGTVYTTPDAQRDFFRNAYGSLPRADAELQRRTGRRVLGHLAWTLRAGQEWVTVYRGLDMGLTDSATPMSQPRARNALKYIKQVAKTRRL